MFERVRRRRDASPTSTEKATTTWEVAGSSESVVEALRSRAGQAAQIAEIEHQELLADPATNPNTRAQLEEVRAAQHAAELGLQRTEIEAELAARAEQVRVETELRTQARRAQVEHAQRAAARARAEQEAADARADRQRRAADRQADTAARVRETRRSAAETALEQVLAARAESSPAHRIAVLRRDRARLTTLAMGGSAVLAIGAAYGMGVVAAALGIATPAGWVAEVGLTVLSVVAIIARTRLTAAGGRVSGWRDRVLWTLFGAPLVASVAITGSAALLADHAPTGLILAAASALGSAAFGVLAHVISEVWASAITAANADVDNTDLEDLSREAEGHSPAPNADTTAEGDGIPAVLHDHLKPGRGSGGAAEHAQRIRTILAPQDDSQDTDGENGPDEDGMTAFDRRVRAAMEVLAYNDELWELASSTRADVLGAASPTPDDARDLTPETAEGSHMGQTEPGNSTATLAEDPEDERGVETGRSWADALVPEDVDTGGEDAVSTSPPQELNTTRAQEAEARIRACVRALRAEGLVPTRSAVRRRTGMDARTVKRHWAAVIAQEEHDD